MNKNNNQSWRSGQTGNRWSSSNPPFGSQQPPKSILKNRNASSSVLNTQTLSDTSLHQTWSAAQPNNDLHTTMPGSWDTRDSWSQPSVNETSREFYQVGTPGEFYQGRQIGTPGEFYQGRQVGTPGEFYQGREVGTSGEFYKGRQVDTPGEFYQGRQVDTPGQFYQGRHTVTSGEFNQGRQTDTSGQFYQGTDYHTSGQFYQGTQNDTYGLINQGRQIKTFGETNQTSESDISGNFNEEGQNKTFRKTSQGRPNETSENFNQRRKNNTSGPFYQDGQNVSSADYMYYQGWQNTTNIKDCYQESLANISESLHEGNQNYDSFVDCYQDESNNSSEDVSKLRQNSASFSLWKNDNSGSDNLEVKDYEKDDMSVCNMECDDGDDGNEKNDQGYDSTIQVVNYNHGLNSIMAGNTNDKEILCDFKQGIEDEDKESSGDDSKDHDSDLTASRNEISIDIDNPFSHNSSPYSPSRSYLKEGDGEFNEELKKLDNDYKSNWELNVDKSENSETNFDGSVICGEALSNDVQKVKVSCSLTCDIGQTESVDEAHPDKPEATEEPPDASSAETKEELTDDSDEDPEHVQSQLFFGNLAQKTTKNEVKKLLCDVAAAEVWLADNKSGNGAVCAFVKMRSLKEAKKYLIESEECMLRGKRIEGRFTAAQDFDDYKVRKPGDKPFRPRKPAASNSNISQDTASKEAHKPAKDDAKSETDKRASKQAHTINDERIQTPQQRSGSRVSSCDMGTPTTCSVKESRSTGLADSENDTKQLIGQKATAENARVPSTGLNTVMSNTAAKVKCVPSRFKEYVDRECLQAPLIGLRYVAEYLDTETCQYMCTLCKMKFTDSRIALHIVTLQHRMNFFEEESPKIFKELLKFAKEHNTDEVAIECAKFVAHNAQPGDKIRHVICKHKLIPASKAVDMDLCSIKEAGLRQLIERKNSLVSRVHGRSKIGSQDSSKIDEFITQREERSNKNITIIGLKYVTEIVGRNHGEVFYVCGLCQCMTYSEHIVTHLTGYKHRMRFFEVHKPDKFHEYKPLYNQAGLELLKLMCLETAQEVEDIEGRCQIFTITEGQKILLEAKHGPMIEDKSKYAASQVLPQTQRIDTPIRNTVTQDQDQAIPPEVPPVTSLPVSEVPPVTSLPVSEVPPPESFPVIEVSLDVFNIGLKDKFIAEHPMFRSVLEAAQSVKFIELDQRVELYRMIKDLDMSSEILPGLQYITEIKNSDDTGDLKQLYACDLCQSSYIIHTTSIIKHIQGQQHGLKVLEKMNADVAHHIDRLSGDSRRHSIDVRLKELHEKQGNGDIKVITVKIQQGADNQCEQKREATGTMFGENVDKKSATSPVECTNARIFSMLRRHPSNKDFPIVGLDYVTEYQNSVRVAEKPTFECKLCFQKYTCDNIYMHLKDSDHRTKYLMKHHRELYVQVKDCRQTLERYCQWVDATVPRKVTVVQIIKYNARNEPVYRFPEIIEDPSYFSPWTGKISLDSIRPASGSSLIQSPQHSCKSGAVQALKFDEGVGRTHHKQQEADPGKKAVFNWKTEYEMIKERIKTQSVVKCARKSKFLTKFAEKAKVQALIGLKELTEFQKPDITTDPWYLCFQCQQKLTWNDVYDHVISRNHRLTYMMKNYRYIYELATWPATTTNMDVSVDKFAMDIQATEGNITGLDVMMDLNIDKEALRCAMQAGGSRKSKRNESKRSLSRDRQRRRSLSRDRQRRRRSLSKDRQRRWSSSRDRLRRRSLSRDRHKRRRSSSRDRHRRRSSSKDRQRRRSLSKDRQKKRRSSSRDRQKRRSLSKGSQRSGHDLSKVRCEKQDSASDREKRHSSGKDQQSDSSRSGEIRGRRNTEHNSQQNIDTGRNARSRSTDRRIQGHDSKIQGHGSKSQGLDTIDKKNIRDQEGITDLKRKSHDKDLGTTSRTICSRDQQKDLDNQDLVQVHEEEEQTTTVTIEIADNQDNTEGKLVEVDEIDVWMQDREHNTNRKPFVSPKKNIGRRYDSVGVDSKGEGSNNVNLDKQTLKKRLEEEVGQTNESLLPCLATTKQQRNSFKDKGIIAKALETLIGELPKEKMTTILGLSMIVERRHPVVPIPPVYSCEMCNDYNHKRKRDTLFSAKTALHHILDYDHKKIYIEHENPSMFQEITAKFKGKEQLICRRILDEYCRQLFIKEGGLENIRKVITSEDCFSTFFFGYTREEMEDRIQRVLSTALYPSVDDDSTTSGASVQNSQSIIRESNLLKGSSSDEIGVKFGHVKSPSQFYLKPTENDSFDRMWQYLQTVYSDKVYDPSIVWTAGSYCVVYSQEEYHRARITKVFAGRALLEVLLVDNGMTDYVPVGDVHQLVPRFTKVPSNAVHCKVLDVSESGYSEEWPSCIYSFMNPTWNMAIIRKGDAENGVYPVDLFIKEKNNYVEVLRRKRLAVQCVASQHNGKCDSKTNKVDEQQIPMSQVEKKHPETISEQNRQKCELNPKAGTGDNVACIKESKKSNATSAIETGQNISNQVLPRKQKSAGLQTAGKRRRIRPSRRFNRKNTQKYFAQKHGLPVANAKSSSADRLKPDGQLDKVKHDRPVRSGAGTALDTSMPYKEDNVYDAMNELYGGNQNTKSNLRPEFKNFRKGQCPSMTSMERQSKSGIGRESRRFEIGQESRFEIGQDIRFEIGQDIRFEIGPESRFEIGQESRFEIGQESRRSKETVSNTTVKSASQTSKAKTSQTNTARFRKEMIHADESKQTGSGRSNFNKKDAPSSSNTSTYSSGKQTAKGTSSSNNSKNKSNKRSGDACSITIQDNSKKRKRHGSIKAENEKILDINLSSDKLDRVTDRGSRTKSPVREKTKSIPATTVARQPVARQQVENITEVCEVTIEINNSSQDLLDRIQNTNDDDIIMSDSELQALEDAMGISDDNC